MSAHPPITWGQMKRWAEDNQIPDDAVMVDQNERPIRDLDSGPDYWDAEERKEVPYFKTQTRWG